MDTAVEFSAVDEYLEELERDVALAGDRVVVRNVVRLGSQYTTFIGGRRVYVRSSFVSDQAVIGIRRSQQLVELLEFVGVLMGGPDDERVMERTQAIAAAIRETCERLGLEVRNGAHRAVA